MRIPEHIPAIATQRGRVTDVSTSIFLAGFPKSGTSTLHSVLSKHEMIVGDLQKETQWWTRMPLDDEDPNYLRLATLRYIQYLCDPANPQLLVYDGSQSTQISALIMRATVQCQ